MRKDDNIISCTEIASGVTVEKVITKYGERYTLVHIDGREVSSMPSSEDVAMIIRYSNPKEVAAWRETFKACKLWVPDS